LKEQIETIRGRQREIVAAARQRLVAAAAAKKPAGDAATLPAVNARRNEDSFAPITAKFVRFTIIRTNSGQPCLDELEVFGPADETNLALASAGSKAMASSLLPGYAIHQIHHLNDGKYGNSHSWISNEPGGWAQIEFAKAAEVNRVVWGRDRDGRYTDRVPQDYRIEVSLDARNWTRVGDASRRATPDRSPDSQIADKEILESLTPAERQAYDDLERESQTVQTQINALSPLPTTYTIRDGQGQAAMPVLKRGDVRAHGELAAAGALSAIANLQSELAADSGPQRRLRLARWIADSKNPLTARVLVNRIWHYHFGLGIVDTPSDFGFKGGAPSHPELLDWLAADFVEHGWKIKRLHRQIVLSATYRQSSAYRTDAAQQDADNRLLWRCSPRRLEAEAVRDMILQLSGKLDRTVGGPSFELFQYRDGNVPDYQLVQQPGPQTWRRSVYGYNIRTFRSPLMAAFDCPDPSVSTPSRSQTTNPLQALSLLNNHFVVEQAGFIADRIRAAAGEDAPSQVAAAYQQILLREPTAAQRDRAVAFLDAHGLAGLCRILLNSNEFLYVF
jgi:hypothetical protein